MDDAARSVREFGITFFDRRSRASRASCTSSDRSRAHPAGHDHRVRRLAHVHARRVRRDRVRHRHDAGARRARHPDAGARQAEGSPHQCDRQARPGVYAKDVILHIIRMLGVNGGTGFAYEYGGDVFDRFSMEERMTVCNMSIEGGARVRLREPRRDDVRLSEGPSVSRRRARRGTRPSRTGMIASRCGRRLRRRRQHRRGRHRADGDLGHQARAGHLDQRETCPTPRRPSRRPKGARSRRRSST